MRFGFLLLMYALAGGAPLAQALDSDAQVAAGSQLFQSSGCTHCHGEGLQGTDVAPSLRDVGKRLKPEAIENQIHNGGQGMPAFGDVLTSDQVAQLVAYLRKQKSRLPKAVSTPGTGK